MSKCIKCYKYVNILLDIDGKRVTLEELGMFVNRYQGFQIKIEIADVTDDLL